VGAIFRTADAAGVSKIYLTGYTPAPLDRFGRAVSEIEKTALGAEKTISWEKVEDISELISKLQQDNFQIVAVEQAEKAVDYKEAKLADQAAIILGNEVDGVDGAVLDQCDLIAEIPMRGEKESLNVSVSAGVALFRLLNI
jgi:tRNA G18 (ribose-2'-O)-methylase SpoU